ncbi:hypothetical protein [Paenarthrobacter nicotinovorans]|uniref:hypothetical protein n=1 Tax=Paenarthrobacter nicotinovorans TaxID=29320 RepID=UPI0039A51D21
MTSILKAQEFGKLFELARKACTSSPATNLILSLESELPVSQDPFLASYAVKAAHWQAKKRPDHLIFNHGEYMHRYGDSLEFLATEFKRKPTGNRACISLVDMRDIIDSKDGRLPSFLFVQASVENEKPATLLLTAYYRALEVGSFLPINFAELALIADRLQVEVPSLNRIELTIHAFRAHYAPGYRPHERSQLDMMGDSEIRISVNAKEYGKVAGWLNDKARSETIIEISGLAILLDSITAAKWDTDIVQELTFALSDATRLKTMRENASHAPGITGLQKQYSGRLRGVASSIQRLDKK